jgi:hypothetical protein
MPLVGVLPNQPAQFKYRIIGSKGLCTYTRRTNAATVMDGSAIFRFSNNDINALPHPFHTPTSLNQFFPVFLPSFSSRMTANRPKQIVKLQIKNLLHPAVSQSLQALQRIYLQLLQRQNLPQNTYSCVVYSDLLAAVHSSNATSAPANSSSQSPSNPLSVRGVGEWKMQKPRSLCFVIKLLFCRPQ